MNFRQAQRLSIVATAVRTGADGSVQLWTAGDVPSKLMPNGALQLDYTALHYLHFEDDWQPLKPTPEGERLLRSGEQIPRYDLIDSIRKQIADGTYMTDAKLDVAFRRMITESQ